MCAAFQPWDLVQQSAKHTSNLCLYPTPVFLNYILTCLISLPASLSLKTLYLAF